MDLTPEIIDAFWSHVKKLDGASACWLWTRDLGSNGAGRFLIGMKTYSAARIAWTIINGPMNARTNLWRKTDVCRAKACVRPEHFRYGQPTPGTTGNAKITMEIAREVRERYINGEPVLQIAADLHLNEESIRRINRGETWKHISEEAAEPASAPDSSLVKDRGPGCFVIGRRGREHVLDDLRTTLEQEIPQIVQRLEMLTLRVAIEGDQEPTVTDLDSDLTAVERCERGVRLLRDLKRFLNR